MSTVLQSDLMDIVRNDSALENYKNKTVLITGATGLIGSLLVKTFALFNQIRKANVRIVAMIRKKKKAETVFGDLISCKEIEWYVTDINEPIVFEGNIDFVFHTAAITASKMMIEEPVQTIMTSIRGTNNVLELAANKHVQSFVYVSSMEVYGKIDIETKITEECMGYINPLSVRSNYPESKRMCENLCIAYGKQYGLHIKIARLAQTFGAGILPTENRVFAQFAKSVIENKDIVLHTKGLSYGNYCYTTDCIRALLLLAVRGEDGEAYNVSNEESHMTIADMAHMLADQFSEGKIQVVFDIPSTNVFGYAVDTKMHLSSQKLQALGWTPRVSLEESYRRLIAYMKERAVSE